MTRRPHRRHNRLIGARKGQASSLTVYNGENRLHRATAMNLATRIAGKYITQDFAVLSQVLVLKRYAFPTKTSPCVQLAVVAWHLCQAAR